MDIKDMVLVSVDDHAVKPPHVFEGRLPRPRRSDVRSAPGAASVGCSCTIPCLQEGMVSVAWRYVMRQMMPIWRNSNVKWSSVLSFT